VVRKGEGTTPIGSDTQTKVNALTAILTNAGDNNPVTVQFGSDGEDELDVGTTATIFNGNWGKITLTGKVAGSPSANGVISIAAISADVESMADIRYTGNTGNIAALFYNGTGTLTISGGNITGGAGMAVRSQSTGTVIISEGVLLTSSGFNNAYGTITIGLVGTGPTTVASNLIINGGTIRNTASTVGAAITNSSNGGTVTITGGTIETNVGRAFFNDDTNSTVNISGVDTVIRAVNLDGYGVFNRSATANITIQNGTISAMTNGRAVHNDNADGTIIIHQPPTRLFTGGTSVTYETATNKDRRNTTTGTIVWEPETP
jgi:hypothetical protein